MSNNIKTIKKPIRIPNGSIKHNAGMSEKDSLRVELLRFKRYATGLIAQIDRVLEEGKGLQTLKD